MRAKTTLPCVLVGASAPPANRRQPIFLPLKVEFMLDWVVVSRLVRMQGASTWNIQTAFPTSLTLRSEFAIDSDD
jgi:hypothetical protein